MNNRNGQTTPSFMDDVRSVLKEISSNPHQGVAIRYCADELLARWDGEAPKPGGPDERDAKIERLERALAVAYDEAIPAQPEAGADSSKEKP